MTKKRKSKSIAAPPLPPADWTVGKWRGRDNYECAHCAFATLDQDGIADHVAKRHRPPPQIHRPSGLILDADGAPITAPDAAALESLEQPEE